MTQIEIINAALHQIGVSKISALTDSSEEARVAATQYPVALREALGGGVPWSFGKAHTARLSAATSETPDERERYALPSGWMVLSKVYEGVTGTELSYTLVDNYLEMDLDVDTTNGLYVEYVGISDEGELPPYFLPYLVAVCSSYFCLPLTENDSRAAAAEVRARRLKNDAMFADAASRGQRYLGQLNEYTTIAGR